MEDSNILKFEKLFLPAVIVFFGAALRLIDHPANFAPIAAMALFGGAYLDKKYALVIPLIALFISDLFLGFHSTMHFVYLSFILSGLIGLAIKKNRNLPLIFGSTLLSSILFFLITNLGVWRVGDIYPLTLDGLIDCYYLAIPFFRNTILGDLFYVTVFAGSFEVIVSLSKSLNYGYLHKDRG